MLQADVLAPEGRAHRGPQTCGSHRNKSNLEWSLALRLAPRNSGPSKGLGQAWGDREAGNTITAPSPGAQHRHPAPLSFWEQKKPVRRHGHTHVDWAVSVRPVLIGPQEGRFKRQDTGSWKMKIPRLMCGRMDLFAWSIYPASESPLHCSLTSTQ